jgi:hypothetical protein
MTSSIAIYHLTSAADPNDILHAGYERGVGIRRDDPLLLQVRLEKVF